MTDGAPPWDKSRDAAAGEGADHRRAEKLLCRRSRSRCCGGARQRRSRPSRSSAPRSSPSICRIRPRSPPPRSSCSRSRRPRCTRPGCARARRITRRRSATGLRTDLAYSAVEYLEALRWRGPALAAHLAAIGDVDVVLAPASRAAAPKIDGDRCRRRPECRGARGRGDAVHAAGQLSRRAGACRAGRPFGSRTADRPAIDRAAVSATRRWSRSAAPSSRRPTNICAFRNCNEQAHAA